jgi:hypothetical protein
MRVRVRWIWCDMWVGAHWDRARAMLYVCPLPTIALVVIFAERCESRELTSTCRPTGYRCERRPHMFGVHRSTLRRSVDGFWSSGEVHSWPR